MLAGENRGQVLAFSGIVFIFTQTYKKELDMAAEKKSRTWLKDLLVAFAATTLSIILTFGTTAVVNRINS